MTRAACVAVPPHSGIMQPIALWRFQLLVPGRPARPTHGLNFLAALGSSAVAGGGAESQQPGPLDSSSCSNLNASQCPLGCSVPVAGLLLHRQVLSDEDEFGFAPPLLPQSHLGVALGILYARIQTRGLTHCCVTSDQSLNLSGTAQVGVHSLLVHWSNVYPSP